MKVLLDIAKGLGATLGARIEGFMRWWINELITLLPNRLQRMLRGTRDRLVLELSDGEVRVLECKDGTEQELMRGSLEDGAAARKARRVLGAQRRHGRDIALRLPAGEVLERRLTLPLAAEENLRQVLAFEMDRHTPFTAEQVYYDFVLIERNAAKNTLRVALALIPRWKLDEPLNRLFRWGFRPGSVDLAGDGRLLKSHRVRSIDLQRDTADGRHAAAGRVWQRAAAALAAALLIAAVAVPLVQKRQAVEELHRAVEQIAAQARGAESTRLELEKWMAESGFLVQKKKQMPAVIDVLEELSRILPDDTWLDRLELRGDNIRIQGESAAASALISLIEQSTALQDTRFAAPVTRSPRSGLERFVITARIAHRGQP